MHTTVETPDVAYSNLQDAVKLLDNAVQTATEANARGDHDISYRQDIALWASAVARHASAVAKLALTV